MANETKEALAKTVYSDLCKSLDKRGWHYKKHEEDLVVTFTFDGEDLPMDFVLAVDTDRQLLRVFSRLPFTVPEDKRKDLAVATCVATYGLMDGSFDYDIEKGTISYRLTASFRESKIGDGLFQYLIIRSNLTVDKFNDRFLALCKGFISLDDFIANKE